MNKYDSIEDNGEEVVYAAAPEEKNSTPSREKPATKINQDEVDDEGELVTSTVEFRKLAIKEDIQTHLVDIENMVSQNVTGEMSTIVRRQCRDMVNINGVGDGKQLKIAANSFIDKALRLEYIVSAKERAMTEIMNHTNNECVALEGRDDLEKPDEFYMNGEFDIHKIMGSQDTADLKTKHSYASSLARDSCASSYVENDTFCGVFNMFERTEAEYTNFESYDNESLVEGGSFNSFFY